MIEFRKGNLSKLREKSGEYRNLEVKKTQFVSFIVVPSTIFHPQGGGQPSDVGTLTNANGGVFHVTMVSAAGPNHPTGTILHIGTFAEGATPFQQGEAVAMQVDLDHRRACARAHSAGHLIDQAMVRAGMEMQGLKGFHFLSGSYVEFDGKVPAEDRAPLIVTLQKYMDELVAECVPTRIVWVQTLEELSRACLPGAGCGVASRIEQGQGPVRIVQVGGPGGCPCGGTHVTNTKEIGKVTVTKIKVKKGVTKVSYKIV